MKCVNHRTRLSSGLMACLLFLLPGGCESWDPLSPVTQMWDSSEGSAVIEETGGPDQTEKNPPSTEEKPLSLPSEEDEAAGSGDGAGPEGPPPPDGDTVPSDLGGVRWLHTDVSGWSETGTLRTVRVSGGTITLDYDKAKSWPGVDHAGAFVNANPWIFVNVSGVWYAATWEWLRVGQTSKSTRSVAGDHIKKHPLGNFRPRSGEVYGFMVSGLARDSARNVRERTQVLMYRWP